MRNNQNYNSKNDNFLLSLSRNDRIVGISNFILQRRQVNFLVCQSCFWCASYLYGCYKVAESSNKANLFSGNERLISVDLLISTNIVIRFVLLFTCLLSNFLDSSVDMLSRIPSIRVLVTLARVCSSNGRLV